MVVNFADDTPMPLYPTHREFAPYGLFYGYPEHPPVPQNSCENISPLPIDDKNLEKQQASISIEKQVSFVGSTQSSSPYLMPIKEYHYPQKGQPTPFFIVGRYRFPAPSHRLLPTTFLRPEHAPLHPGMFPSPQFEDEIWPSTPLDINDSHIIAMSPEHTYFGIDYVINVHDSTWAKQPIS